MYENDVNGTVSQGGAVGWGRRLHYEEVYLGLCCLWFGWNLIRQIGWASGSILGISRDLISQYVLNTVLIGLALLLVFARRYRERETIRIMIITILVALTVWKSGLTELLVLWLLVAAGKGVQLRRIIRVAYVQLASAVIILLILYLTGTVEDSIVIRKDSGQICHSLGFEGANHLGMRVFQLATCHVYLHWGQMHLKDYLLIALTAIASRMVLGCETAEYCLLLLLAAAVLLPWLGSMWKKGYVIIADMMAVAVGLCSAVTVCLTIIGTGEKGGLLYKIDQWLSGRFILGHILFLEYGTKWFGQDGILLSASQRAAAGLKGERWLDSSFALLLIRGGIVITALMFVGLTVAAWRLRRVRPLALILCLNAAYGLMEPYQVYVSYNVFLLCLIWAVFPEVQVQKAVPDRRQHMAAEFL